MLVNELIANGKAFTMMSYPNRSHGISEGPGTTLHLYTLLTTYLNTHMPPGGR
jgi:dipeptidyl-peptidase-4